MTRQIVITWLGSFFVITFFSVLWHVGLFEQQYLNLQVFTRMDNPIYPLGFLAWIMEATAITWLYVGSKWAQKGLLGALSLSWAVNLFLAASTVAGTAAKMQIDNLALFFVLTSGFALVHSTTLGLWLHFAPKSNSERKSA